MAEDREAAVLHESELAVRYVLQWLRTADPRFVDLFLGTRLVTLMRADTLGEGHAFRLRQAAVTADCQWLQSVVPAGLSAEDGAALGAIWRQLNADLLLPVHGTLDILFVGNCLSEDIRSFLRVAAVRDGVWLREHLVWRHGGASQRKEIAELAGHGMRLVFFSPVSYARNPGISHLRRWRLGALGADSIRLKVDTALEETRQIIDVLASVFECPVYLHDTVNVHYPEQPGLASAAKRLLSARTRRIARE